MEQEPKKSEYRKNYKKVVNYIKQQPIQKTEIIPEESVKLISDPILIGKLYLKIQDAINCLLSEIVSECTRRIASIKKTTLYAAQQITKLKDSLNEMLKNQSLSNACIMKLKDFSIEASFYYKPQCEKFNLFIDKLANDIGKTEINTGENLPNVIGLNSKESRYNWNIVKKDGSMIILPDWVSKQIEAGVGFDAEEIKIYRKSENVSIADIKNMVYYGLSNGKKLPGQELKKIEIN